MLLPIVAVLLLAGCGVRSHSAPTSRTERADRVLGQGIGGRVIVEPRDGDRSLIRALDRAERSIFMEAYILTNRSIIHALERAATQSVVVHVLLERHPIGMGVQPETAASELRAAGIAVRWSSPSFALTHAKVLVVDDRAALVSTANFSRAGIDSNRDFMIWDTAPRDVYALSSVLRGDWNRSPEDIHAPNLVIAPSSARFKLQALVRNSTLTLEMYGEEMRDAQFERLLAAVACRGIKVRVILPSPPTIGSPIYHLGCVQMRVLTRPYVHAKIILVDGRRGYLGSENISTQSLDRNREIGVLLRGGPVRQLVAIFNRDWKRGLPVHASES